MPAHQRYAFGPTFRRARGVPPASRATTPECGAHIDNQSMAFGDLLVSLKVGEGHTNGRRRLAWSVAGTQERAWPVHLTKCRLQHSRLLLPLGGFVGKDRGLLARSRQRPESVQRREVERGIKADRPGKGAKRIPVAPPPGEDHTLNSQRQSPSLPQRHRADNRGPCLAPFRDSHASQHLFRDGYLADGIGRVRRDGRSLASPGRESNPPGGDARSCLSNALLKAKKRWLGDNHIDPRCSLRRLISDDVRCLVPARRHHDRGERPPSAAAALSYRPSGSGPDILAREVYVHKSEGDCDRAAAGIRGSIRSVRRGRDGACGPGLDAQRTTVDRSHWISMSHDMTIGDELDPGKA